MSDVLTQEEINALLSAFSQQEEAPATLQVIESSSSESKSVVRFKNVKRYDFLRPDKFSKDQLRTLQMLHETFARYVSSSLSAYLRAGVKVNLVNVQQSIYDEFLSSLQNPSVMYIIGLEPLSGRAVLEINSPVAFCMLDRMLGGNGKIRLRMRELTEIEQTLMRGVMNRLLEELKLSWEHLLAINPKVEGYETNPQFAQIIPPNDPVCLMTFEVKIGDTYGSMNICLPYVLLQPIISKLSAQQWFGDSRSSGDKEKDLLPKPSIDKVSVPVSVELGRAHISLKDVVELEVGDVIKLDTSANGELKLVIGKTPKFSCIPGVDGKRMAIQITRALEPEEA